VPLYEPHKWLGVAALGAAVLQLAAAAFRPGKRASGRGAWDFVHHTWGRVVVVAGAANAFVGAFLMHAYRGQPLWQWLAPAFAAAGALLFATALLEAMRLQMRRTNRYDPKTDELHDVLDACKRSPKRGGGAAAAGRGCPCIGAAPVDPAAASGSDSGGSDVGKV
jgi:hypothetical protein